MNFKGSTNNINAFKTPEDNNISEEPLDSKKKKSGRVDINVLRSKLEDQQNRDFRKNFIVFIFCVFFLGAIGIYLSL
ncbi:hypothetical protein OBA37_02305 [Candidatus Pelagibacter sp.]|nr:hypothetical protein [Candidatus Pelagibacter sp.]